MSRSAGESAGEPVSASIGVGRPVPPGALVAGCHAVMVIAGLLAVGLLYVSTRTQSMAVAFVLVLFGAVVALLGYVQYRAVYKHEAGACDGVAIICVAVGAFSIPLAALAGAAMLESVNLLTILLTLAGLAGSVMGFGMAFLLSRWAAVIRHQAIAPTCADCDYDLTGTLMAAGDACPECGRRIAPEVVMWFRRKPAGDHARSTAASSAGDSFDAIVSDSKPVNRP